MTVGVDQFRAFIVRPTLKYLSWSTRIPYSLSAENIVLGTIAQESQFKAIKQYGGGPAVGLIQCEPPTHTWCRQWLGRPQNRGIRDVFDSVLSPWPRPIIRQLVTSLPYQILVCRWRYWVARGALPAAHDLSGLAEYWKENYNTIAGAGTVAEFKRNYKRLVL